MMKISGVEKGILCLTAAFLFLTVGFFLGQRSGAQSYDVSAQTLWTQEVGAGVQNSAGDTQQEPVNINTASVSELQTLPGIGQVRAEAIVADRQANGPFRIPEDLIRVSGIGQGTLENLLDYITVG